MSPALQLNLSCGQTDLYPAARQAMSQALPNPIYYPPFHDVEGDCVTMLREILHTAGDVLLPLGSATYGEEAAFNTFLEHGEICVTVNTGMFGQVLTDLVTVVGATAAEVKLPRGTAITVDQARQALRDHPQARMLAVVHLETTAGTLNPVREIGAMIREEFPHVLFLVDAVSSLTSEPLHIDEWGIDICCTSSQKCVNAPQGIAIVAAGPRAWQVAERRLSPIPGLCLDLVTWRRWHHGQEQARAMARGEAAPEPIANGDSAEDSSAVDTSVTAYKAAHGPSQSYSLLLALQGALREIVEEGPDRVIARHAAAGRALRAGVRAMGLRVLADERIAASCSTCVVMPGDTFPTQDYMQTVWREYGIATAGGSQAVGEMGYAGSRIGLMGFVANLDSVCAILSAMEQVLPRYGVSVTPDAPSKPPAAPSERTGRLSGPEPPLRSVNPRVAAVPRSGIREIMDLAQRPGVIHLEIGQPDFPTPAHIVAAANHAAERGHIGYTANAGMPELCEALAAKLHQDNGVRVATEQVIVTIGAMGALYGSLLSVLEPGDQLLVPDPGYPNYRMTAELCGAESVPYPLPAADGYQPDLDALAAAISPRTKAIVVGSPSNPTGTVIHRDRLQGIVELAERHDLYLVSDECYEKLVFDGRHVSPASLGAGDRCFTVGSFSKSYAMTGWRVGYVACPKPIVPLLVKLQEATVSCAPVLSQHAALAALAGPQECVAAWSRHTASAAIWPVNC